MYIYISSINSRFHVIPIQALAPGRDCRPWIPRSPPRRSWPLPWNLSASAVVRRLRCWTKDRKSTTGSPGVIEKCSSRMSWMIFTYIYINIYYINSRCPTIKKKDCHARCASSLELKHWNKIVQQLRFFEAEVPSKPYPMGKLLSSRPVFCIFCCECLGNQLACGIPLHPMLLSSNIGVAV